MGLQTGGSLNQGLKTGTSQLGKGGISQPSVAAGQSLPHVADANARLSLTAEGVVVSAGDASGIYHQENSINDRPAYFLTGADHRVFWDGAQWNIGDNHGPLFYYLPFDVPNPYSNPASDWIADAGTGDLPTVTHQPGDVTGAGWQCTQDDEGNAIVHTFLGDGADADAGLRVKDAGDAIRNGPYSYNGSHSTYDLVGDGATQVESGPAWVMGSAYSISSGSTYPWEQSWNSDSGEPPAPTVQRNPICSEINWTPEP